MKHINPANEDPMRHHAIVRGIACTVRWLHMNTFTPRGIPRRWQPPPVGYSVALLLQLTLGLISMTMLRSFPNINFFGILQLLGVLIIAWLWGVGPGLVATMTGAAIIVLVHKNQILQRSIDGMADLIGLGIYLVVGCAISSLVSQAIHARNDAERLALILQQAQQTEAQRANEFAVLFDSLVDGVIVFDSVGGIVQANAAYRQLCTDPHVVELPLRERMAYFDIRTGQGVVIPFEEMPNMRILRGEVLQGQTAIDLQIHSPGQGIRYHNTNGAPLRNEAGAITGGVMVLRDFTERRQWEKRIRDALDAVVAIASEIVRIPIKPETVAEVVAQHVAELICHVLHCRRLTITTVNPANDCMRFAAITGLTPEQEMQLRTRIEERAIGEFLSEEQIAQLQRGEVFATVFPKLPAFTGVEFMSPKVLLAPMLVEGRLIGIINIDLEAQENTLSSEDMMVAATIAKLSGLVLEREKLLQQQTTAQAHILALQQAKERMDIFLNMATHELRTPLTSVVGYIQLARKRLSRMQEAPEGKQEREGAHLMPLLDDADKQATLLNRLVGDLVEASRAEAKKLSLQAVECDITDVIQEAIQGQLAAWPNRQITLQREEETPLLVRVDVGRILQVVTNYLTNALKYSPPEQPVAVGLRRDGEQVRVLISDKGPGIPPEEQKHIWERFYRVEGALPQNNVIPGFGMGLYLSRAIIEQHGGQVGVESCVGEGAIFWFTLPMYREGS